MFQTGSRQPQEAETACSPAHSGCKRARSIRDVPIAQQVTRAGDVITQVNSKSSASQQVTSKSFSSDKGCNGQGSNDQGSNRQASTSHHAPYVVTDDDPGVTGHDEDDDMGVTGHDEDDDTGVTGHDEDDDMGVSGHDEDDDTGVTRDQAVENNEQLRRFRGNVHTLLSFLVDLRLLDLPDTGPLEEIEDYVKRLLSTFGLSFE